MFKKELLAERAKYMRIIEACQRRLRAIDELLTPIDLPELEEASAKGSKREQVPGTNGGGGSQLWKAIRPLLEAGPLKSGQIIEALIAGGFKTSGKVPLKNQVWNELHRLKTRGLVDQDNAGRYVLLPEAIT